MPRKEVRLLPLVVLPLRRRSEKQLREIAEAINRDYNRRGQGEPDGKDT